MERVYKSVSAVGLLNGDLADTLRANLMNSVQQKGAQAVERVLRVVLRGVKTNAGAITCRVFR